MKVKSFIETVTAVGVSAAWAGGSGASAIDNPSNPIPHLIDGRYRRGREAGHRVVARSALRNGWCSSDSGLAAAGP